MFGEAETSADGAGSVSGAQSGRAAAGPPSHQSTMCSSSVSVAAEGVDCMTIPSVLAFRLTVV